MGNANKKNKKKAGPPVSFYTRSLKDYHDKANALGYVGKELVIVPELSEYGNDAVMWYLKNDTIQQEIGDPVAYYSVAVATAIRCGIIFASQWHKDFSKMQEPGYVLRIMASNPFELSDDIMKQEMKMDAEAYQNLECEMFGRWLALMNPHWQMDDPRKYIVQATNAAYQIGVSLFTAALGL